MYRHLTRELRRDASAPQFRDSWHRQLRTADEILHRLQHQEGVVLADQVGMGKTYVACAVAASVLLNTPEWATGGGRQVAIVVPPGVASKWVGEWARFASTYLGESSGLRGPTEPITKADDFLKALDDPDSRHVDVLVVTHTALSRLTVNHHIQLALVWAATGGTHPSEHGERLRRTYAKWCGEHRGLIEDRVYSTAAVLGLLAEPPAQWRTAWARLAGEDLDDDPVPHDVLRALARYDLSEVRDILERLPRNRIPDARRLGDKLVAARAELAAQTTSYMRQVLARSSARFPLLVLDEAHAAKNDGTRLAQMFAATDSTSGRGVLHGVADRMLLLTATPFALGNDEFVRILRRLGATTASGVGRPESLDDVLDRLGHVMAAAQEAGQLFDAAWSRLADGAARELEAWEPVDPPVTLSSSAAAAWTAATLAVEKRQAMHAALSPWVIRHERIKNRTIVPGAAILDSGLATEGIAVPNELSLPFLLAARAQSLGESGSRRPYFAYGIASSFAAFLRIGEDDRDSDLDAVAAGSGPDGAAGDSDVEWYRRQIETSILDGGEIRARHPKIDATVRRAVEQWEQFEKTVVFCWYVRTGGRLQEEITRQIAEYVMDRGSRAFGVDRSDEVSVRREYRNLAVRLLPSGADARTNASYQAIHGYLTDSLHEHVGRGPETDAVVLGVAEVAIRNVRTPEFLSRCARVGHGMSSAEVIAELSERRPGGEALIDRWVEFAERLLQPGFTSSRATIMEDLIGHFSEDTSDEWHGATEHPHAGRASIRTVRWAQGKMRLADRVRLTSIFNTPSAPEVLVASSVMGEGIDLHMNCDTVIHHDLDWNPGVIEQRTGRIERIGSLAERRGKGINVYVPYLAGTHDEKMFRVVEDRRKWFEVVMGRDDGESPDSAAEEHRQALPDSILSAMSMSLEA